MSTSDEEFAEFLPEEGWDHPRSIEGMMQRILYWLQCSAKMERDIREELDPEGQSVYLKNARDKRREVLQALQDKCEEIQKRPQLSQDELSENEISELDKFMSDLAFWAERVKLSLHVLRGCYDNHGGITPVELHRLARYYEVDGPPSALADWDILERIWEKAFLAERRRVAGLHREPRVSDEQVLTVVNNVKTHKKQADVLNISDRHLYRLKKALRETGKLEG